MFFGKTKVCDGDISSCTLAENIEKCTLLNFRWTWTTAYKVGVYNLSFRALKVLIDWVLQQLLHYINTAAAFRLAVDRLPVLNISVIDVSTVKWPANELYKNGGLQLVCTVSTPSSMKAATILYFPYFSCTPLVVEGDVGYFWCASVGCRPQL